MTTRPSLPNLGSALDDRQHLFMVLSVVILLFSFSSRCMHERLFHWDTSQDTDMNTTQDPPSSLSMATGLLTASTASAVLFVDSRCHHWQTSPITEPGSRLGDTGCSIHQSIADWWIDGTYAWCRRRRLLSYSWTAGVTRLFYRPKRLPNGHTTFYGTEIGRAHV